ncbi:TIGR03643 family protein [Polaribacter atrinae]|uniref:TIGR03643 family protein n=1 Tax=Polaribacter atrinae TaxID=1333662 RepID=UPI0031F0E792
MILPSKKTKTQSLKNNVATTVDVNKELTERQLDRIIEMAWEDRTPFEAIKFQFGFAEKEVIKLMRKTLKESSFKRWRKRVNRGVSTKHLKKRSQNITRFKCTRQRAISGNKISKR